MQSEKANYAKHYEVYIADREAKQQAVVALNDEKLSSWNSENPPVWSHEAAMKRQRHIRERALRKWKLLNNYQ